MLPIPKIPFWTFFNKLVFESNLLDFRIEFRLIEYLPFDFLFSIRRFFTSWNSSHSLAKYCLFSFSSLTTVCFKWLIIFYCKRFFYERILFSPIMVLIFCSRLLFFSIYTWSFLKSSLLFNFKNWTWAWGSMNMVGAEGIFVFEGIYLILERDEIFYLIRLYVC